MSGYYEEPQHHFITRRNLPHCSTCICHDDGWRKSRESPEMRPIRPHYDLERRYNCCQRCYSPNVAWEHYSPKDDWERYPSKNKWERYPPKNKWEYHSPKDNWEPRDIHKDRYNGVSPPLKLTGDGHCDNKFALLESWFKRFDVDGNGLLDVHELKKLLNFLGIKAEQDYVKDLIRRSDRDSDGMLSFSDFLHMWHKVNQDEIDLYEIMKEHGLQPDIPSKKVRPLKRHANKKLKDKGKTECLSDCSCGNIRKVENVPKKRPDKIETIRSPTQNSERIPIMSNNR